jgi:hypothetical protein
MDRTHAALAKEAHQFVWFAEPVRRRIEKLLHGLADTASYKIRAPVVEAQQRLHFLAEVPADLCSSK